MKNILRNSIHIGTVFILLVGFKTVMPAFWVGHYGDSYECGTNLIEADVPNNTLSRVLLPVANNYLSILRIAKEAIPLGEPGRLNLVDLALPISNDSLRVNLKFQLIDIDPTVVTQPFNAVWHSWALRNNFVQWGHSSNILSGLLNQNGLVQTGGSPIALNTLQAMQVYPHDGAFSPNNGHFSLADNTKVAFFWATATHKVNDMRTISFIPTLLNTSPALSSLLKGPEIKSLFPGSFDQDPQGLYLTYKDLINILKIVSGNVGNFINNNDLNDFPRLSNATHTFFENFYPLTPSDQNLLKPFYRKINETRLTLRDNDRESLKMAYTFLQTAFATELQTPFLMKTTNNSPLQEVIDMGIGIVPVAGVVTTTRPTPSPSTTTLRPLTPAPAPITPSTRVWSTDCASAHYENPPADAVCYICADNENEDENRLINIAYNEGQILENYIHEDCLRTMIGTNTRTDDRGNLLPPTNNSSSNLCPETINRYSETITTASNPDNAILANLYRIIASNIFILNKLITLPTNPDALAFFNDYLNQEYSAAPEEDLNGSLNSYIEDEAQIAIGSLLGFDEPLDLLKTRLSNDVTTLQTYLTTDPANAFSYNNQLREKQDSLRRLTAFESWLRNAPPLTARTTLSTAFDRNALEELIEKINQFNATEASYPEVLKAACAKLPLGWRVQNSPFHSQFLTVSQLSNLDTRQELIDNLTALCLSLTPPDSSSITPEQEEFRKQERFKIYLKQTIDMITASSNIPAIVSEFLNTSSNTYTYSGETFTPFQLYNQLNTENKEIIRTYYHNNSLVMAAEAALQEEIRQLEEQIRLAEEAEALRLAEIERARATLEPAEAEEDTCPICSTEFVGGTGLVMEESLTSSGHPILDSDGNPVMVQVDRRKIKLHPDATGSDATHSLCADCLKKLREVDGVYRCPECRIPIANTVYEENGITQASGSSYGGIFSADTIESNLTYELTSEQVTRATELGLTREQYINTLRAAARDTIITNQIKQSLENNRSFHLPTVGFNLASNPNYDLYDKLSSISDELNTLYTIYRPSIDSKSTFDYMAKYYARKKELSTSPEELQTFIERYWQSFISSDSAIFLKRHLLSAEQQEELKQLSELEKQNINQAFFPGSTRLSQDQHNFIVLMNQFLKLPADKQQELRDFETRLRATGTGSEPVTPATRATLSPEEIRAQHNEFIETALELRIINPSATVEDVIRYLQAVQEYNYYSSINGTDTNFIQSIERRIRQLNEVGLTDDTSSSTPTPGSTTALPSISPEAAREFEQCMTEITELRLGNDLSAILSHIQAQQLYQNYTNIDTTNSTIVEYLRQILSNRQLL